MEWYYVDKGRQCGPVSREDLDQRVRDGRLSVKTLVWSGEMVDWLPYENMAPDSNQALSAPVAQAQGEALPYCIVCGRQFPRESMVAFPNYCVCESCKPIHDQRLREGMFGDGVMIGAAHGSLMIAGFWIRFAAFLIDLLIMYVLNLALGAVGALLMHLAPEVPFIIVGQILISIVSILGALAYEIFFLGKFGATPGKMLLKLKVVTETGGKITWGRATGRVFAKWLSYCTMYIGFIIAAFDPHRRTLHDHICKTRVIKVFPDLI